MIFFLLMLAVFALLQAPPFSSWLPTSRDRARWAMAGLFLVTGTLHLVDPERFTAMPLQDGGRLIFAYWSGGYPSGANGWYAGWIFSSSMASSSGVRPNRPSAYSSTKPAPYACR